MRFEQFKKVFDESFGRVTSDEFIQKMEDLGYRFTDTEISKESIKTDCTHYPDCIMLMENKICGNCIFYKHKNLR